MDDDKKQDFKKNFPNGFVWFLMAAFFLALMVQNFMETKFAKVAFSYQLEPLVNLQLIQPEESRKIALNDNLVSFSGKFRDKETEEGKNRYKFLDLLHQQHELLAEKEQLDREITAQRSKVIDAAQWYLALTGMPVPAAGFTVVDDLSHSTKDYDVTISAPPKKNVQSLLDLREKLNQLQASTPTTSELEEYEKALMSFLQNVRSPLLGIGNETTKDTLKNISAKLAAFDAAKASKEQSLVLFDSTLAELEKILANMHQEDGPINLAQLRTVRNYKEILDAHNQLSSKLEENNVQLDKARQKVNGVIWFFNNQELSTRALEKQDPEVYNHWFTTAKQEWEQMSHNRGGYFKAPDQPLNRVLEKTFKSEEPAPNYVSYLLAFLPVIIVAGVLYAIFSRQMKGVGNNAMSFGKSPAKLLTKGQNKITFKDVAGVDEAIEELQEIVEFLRNPQKFTALGGHIPKGVLCIGPPGTGKTLIAKAVAGEADRPFFSISGSDFVEMFVGVGASRIRDLFDQAKKNAPCIIFMDEIDAVGRHRGPGIGGGHDEREQTLNQLLVEMDGFDTNEGVILMAATNRPDVLDKALLRPGRFDRRVIISLPDIRGRFDILKVHARKIKLDTGVDLMDLAKTTPGCSGADLANILNEAALLAARKGRSAVTKQEISQARDKVLYGKERRNLELDESEKKTTAYHEAGHTIVSLKVKHADPVEKVTIIPRGLSLGATMFLPKKNRVSYWKNELHDELAVLMGGRCAEEIFIGDLSSGAQQDIEQATNLARKMVCEWGMSEKLGAMSYKEHSDANAFGGHSEKQYSEETAKAIDKEVRQILDMANQRALEIIREQRQYVELITEMLIEFETLDSEDIRKILNDEWDINEKRARLKQEEEMHRASAQAPSTATTKESGSYSPTSPVET